MNTSKKIRVLAALGTLSGAVWAGTFATFTDSATATSAFSAGTVDLVMNDESDDAYGFTALEMSNLKPGDTQYALLTVDNAGTLPFTYGMSVVTTDGSPAGLGAALQVGVVKTSTATCTSTTYGTGSAVVAERSLSGAAFSGRSLTAADAVLLTDTEHLCFKVSLPNGAAGAENALQGSSTSAALTLTATQQ